jgi:hypothetical protein
MTLTLEQLRQLVRAKATVISPINGLSPEESALKSRVREDKHKRKVGACWAYVCQCADLKGKVPTCHDSGDPRCAR